RSPVGKEILLSFPLACGAETSVHGPVVDSRRRGTEQMDTAVLTEIESLRRASMRICARSIRRCFRKRHYAATGSTGSGGLRGVCRHGPREISPNGRAGG